ncbi:MAG: hypothetical protein Q8Q12_11260 [bacterium]|nr:hypothetical protein [bacterium]
MKRIGFLIAFCSLILTSVTSFSQTVPQPLDTRKIYITSYFECPVYWNDRLIAMLPRGTRALLILSTKEWILVRYYSRGRYITGWIPRR